MGNCLVGEREGWAEKERYGCCQPVREDCGGSGVRGDDVEEGEVER